MALYALASSATATGCDPKHNVRAMNDTIFLAPSLCPYSCCLWAALPLLMLSYTGAAPHVEVEHVAAATSAPHTIIRRPRSSCRRMPGRCSHSRSSCRRTAAILSCTFSRSARGTVVPPDHLGVRVLRVPAAIVLVEHAVGPCALVPVLPPRPYLVYAPSATAYMNAASPPRPRAWCPPPVLAYSFSGTCCGCALRARRGSPRTRPPRFRFGHT